MDNKMREAKKALDKLINGAIRNGYPSDTALELGKIVSSSISQVEQEPEPESDPFCWTWAGCLYTQDKDRADQMVRRGFNVEALYKTSPQPATIPEVRAQPTQRDVDNALELVRLVESGDLKDCTDNDGVAYQSEWLDESVSRINRFIQEFALTSAERTEAEKVFQDAAQCGSGFIIVGKHVSRSEVIDTPTEEESDDAPAWWVSANGDFTQDPVVVERAARYSHVWEPLYKRPQPATIPDGWKDFLRRLITELSIIDESSGIAGFHLNGDVSPWDEGELPQMLNEAKSLLAAPTTAEEESKPNPHDALQFVGYSNGAQILYASEDGEGTFYNNTDHDTCIPLYMLKTHWHRLESTTNGEVTMDRLRAAQRPQPPKGEE